MPSHPADGISRSNTMSVTETLDKFTDGLKLAERTLGHLRNEHKAPPEPVVQRCEERLLVTLTNATKRIVDERTRLATLDPKFAHTDGTISFMRPNE